MADQAPSVPSINENEREVGLNNALFERFIVFKHLPVPNSVFSHQKNKRVCVADFLSHLLRPKAAGSQAIFGAKNTRDSPSLRSIESFNFSANFWSGEW
jgi:hypothetical protein